MNGAKVGVFASRSPHRPNPVGLTLARLDDIIGNTLFLSGIDILDGTPVLDVKPYVPDYDAPIAVQTANSNGAKENEQCPLQESAGSRCISRPPVNIPEDLVHIEMSSPEVLTSLRRKPAESNIAEWIRKPPIKELHVEFTVDAEDQIRRFHGKAKLRGRCLFETANANAGLSTSSSAGNKRSCFCEVINGPVQCTLISGQTNAKQDQSKSGKQEYRDVASDTDGCQSVVTTCESDQQNRNLRQPSSAHAASLESRSTATRNRKAYDSEKELSRESLCLLRTVRRLGGCKAIESIGNKNVFQSMDAKSVRCLESATRDTSLFPQACIYELEMLSSPDEARKAIVDILRGDPRSTYRRTRCPEQLYHFSIDKINVTCQFDETTVWVLRAEPVFDRAHHAGEMLKFVDPLTTGVKP